MTTDVMSTQISVLCDYDALYSAIELKLSTLPHVHVSRFESNPVGGPETGRPTDDFGLIIVAPIRADQRSNVDAFSDIAPQSSGAGAGAGHFRAAHQARIRR